MSKYNYEEEDFSRRPRREEKDYYSKHKNRIYDITEEDDDFYEDDYELYLDYDEDYK